MKGCNSVANLRKMTNYNANKDLVNDNVLKIGLNKSVRFQGIKHSDVNLGPLLCC